MLRYRDDGADVLHPKSPDPMYRLQDGRYLLFHHNRDGYDQGETGPWDTNASRPVGVSVGEFRPNAHQAIWFSRPKELMDTHRVKAGVQGRFTLRMYASLTEHQGQRTFWYSDRKQFVLGKNITNEMLADMIVPS